MDVDLVSSQGLRVSMIRSTIQSRLSRGCARVIEMCSEMFPGVKRSKWWTLEIRFSLAFYGAAFWFWGLSSGGWIKFLPMTEKIVTIDQSRKMNLKLNGFGQAYRACKFYHVDRSRQHGCWQLIAKHALAAQTSSQTTATSSMYSKIIVNIKIEPKTILKGYNSSIVRNQYHVPCMKLSTPVLLFWPAWNLIWARSHIN